MKDKEIKEMVCKLFDLTIEIEDMERKIKEYETANKTFPPLNWKIDIISKTHEMYKICKEYLYS